MNDYTARSITRTHRMFVKMSDLDETAAYVMRRLGENNHAEFLSAVVLIKRVKYSDASSRYAVRAELATLFYFLLASEVLSGDTHPWRPHRAKEFPFQHDAMSVTYLLIDLMSFIYRLFIHNPT